MRTDCKNFESRSLRTGDSVRRCRLDLAPEAPWRCPADCAAYSPRPLDLAWESGVDPNAAAKSLDEPELTDAAFDILAQAESFLAEAGDSIRAEEAAKQAKRNRRRPFKRRR